MSIRRRVARRRSPLAGLVNASNLDEEIMEEGRNTTVRLPDEVHALEAPAIKLYIEEKFEALAEEQTEVWAAEAGAAVRDPHAAAAESKAGADAQQTRVAHQEKVLDRLRARFESAGNALLPLIVTPRTDGRRYWFWVVLLLLGDIAGMAGAAISLGEVVALAIMQAVSVAAAMIAVGTIAAEIKESRLARSRQKQELTSDEAVFADLFRGPDIGEKIVKLLVAGGLVAVALVFGGIFALRSSVENSAVAGLVYGFLATTVGLGSWFSSYTHQDSAADRYERISHEYSKALRLQRKLAKRGPLAEHARQTSLVETIREECQHAGAAAAARVRAAGREALASIPEAAGHGRALEAPLPTKAAGTDVETEDKESEDFGEPLWFEPAANGVKPSALPS